MQTAGRNDLCPCSSGKKFKHCCLPQRGHVPPGQTQAVAWQTILVACQAGQWQRAADLCHALLRTDPTHADAWGLLGAMACEAGNTASALDCLNKAVQHRPDFPEAHYHLGLIHMNQGRLDQAAAHYRQAIDAAPAFLEAHGNLGVVLNRQGRHLQALDSYLRALSIHEAVEVKIGVAESLQRLRMDTSPAKLKPVLARAIGEAWRRPEELAPAAIDWLTNEPTFRAMLDQPVALSSLAAWQEDPLLLALLANATVCDVALERWLSAVRAALLAAALNPDAPGEDHLLVLRGALAQQCFINEYAWVIGPQEAMQLERLAAHIHTALDRGDAPPASQLLALASYRPLHTLPPTPALEAGAWPEALRAVLRQQIEEPRREAVLRGTLPCLTPIGEGTSCQVRQQYEENPYPRWARSSLFPRPLAIDERLRMQLPHARFEPRGAGEALDVLIAGCGTGRHSTETASHYRGARVLAIDLSASSLAYAKRKSQELGQTNVEYAQADILQLASLPRRFDLIESAGVLHHLAEPEAGWRALLPLLRPGGLMLIGLYSELARAPVVAARRFIAERGFPATPQGIRACREALMNCDCPQALQPLTAFGDFFGLSACRDLLFHEQEHRISLPEIAALLQRLGLSFVGLHVEPAVLNRFRQRFPETDAVNDLQRWHAYEMEHPATFVGMYQFWVQKPR